MTWTSTDTSKDEGGYREDSCAHGVALLTYRPAAPVRSTLIGSPRDNGYPFPPPYPPSLDFPDLISKETRLEILGPFVRYSAIIQVDPKRSLPLPDEDYWKIFPGTPAPLSFRENRERRI